MLVEQMGGMEVTIQYGLAKIQSMHTMLDVLISVVPKWPSLNSIKPR